MADDSQFVPDMDDYLDEVDPDAYLQMEQEMHDEADAMEEEAIAASQAPPAAGQSTQRRLDHAAYGSVH